MLVVDLNADVGEWDSVDEVDASMMPFITSASIACGVHGGNAEVMAATVALAIRRAVRIGAHPGFADRDHFGRRELPHDSETIRNLVIDQVRALADIARQQGSRVRYVKPHGALYNMAARDSQMASAVAEAVADVDASLTLVGLSGSELIRAGDAAGLKTASEAFADRGYQADGSLAPRDIAGAVLSDPDAVAKRAVAMVLQQRIVALDGTVVPVKADTICIHGDTAGAATLAQRVRAALEAAGVNVSADAP